MQTERLECVGGGGSGFLRFVDLEANVAGRVMAERVELRTWDGWGWAVSGALGVL